MKCKVCGCTEETPCPGGCGWVAPNYCSACLEKAGPLSDEERKIAHLVLRGTSVRFVCNGSDGIYVLRALQIGASLLGPMFSEAGQASLEQALTVLITQLSPNAECARLCAEGWQMPHEAMEQDKSGEKLIVTPAEAANEILLARRKP